MKHLHAALAALAIASLAACSGGGTGASPSAQNQPAIPAAPPGPAASSAQALGITFSGMSVLAKLRAQALAGTPVTVTFNGTTVATGTLDANGHAMLTFTQSVPRGSTVTVAAGSLKATLVLSTNAAVTAAQVQANANGTLTVTAAADPAAVASSNGNDDQENETEDDNGNVIAVNNPAAITLPGNLPFTFVSTCSTITLTPKSSLVASLLFEEKLSDGDQSSQFNYHGAFTGPITFPVVGGVARASIHVFDSTGKQLIEVHVPMLAFLAGQNCAGATASGSATATASASASPTAAATASSSGSPGPTTSPGSDDTAEPSERPDHTASPSPTSSPTQSGTATPRPSATASATPSASATPTSSAT